jgi:hypothetical protein
VELCALSSAGCTAADRSTWAVWIIAW